MYASIKIIVMGNSHYKVMEYAGGELFNFIVEKGRVRRSLCDATL
jgi:hypothetical protein